VIRGRAGATVGGGRLGGLKIVGIVIGGLIETPSSRCAEPREDPMGPHPTAVARARAAVAALAERAQVARTQRARRPQQQPPRAAVQPPRSPRLWDPRPTRYRPMLTEDRDRRAVCRPQARRDD